MCVPKEKIYNDAPDEFAEFIDSKRKYAFLSELGGEANPFVVEGIYEPHVIEAKKCCECEYYLYYDRNPEFCDEACAHCEALAERAKNDPPYSINGMRLAEFISDGIGCTVCRQFKKTGWQFGKLRDYDVYFACAPTPGMYKALESTPKSVLIIGMNTPETLPSSLATRVIYLSRLLYVEGGMLHIAHEAIDEKIPQRGGRSGPHETVSPNGGHRKPSRPPVQVYAPFYVTMIREWLEHLRNDDKVGTPTIKWITKWMHDNCHIQGLKPVKERQTRRHVAALMKESTTSRHDRRSPTFAVYWNGCNDRNFIMNFSEKDITTLIIKTFEIAKQTGFKVKPMRDMDAADYAGRSKENATSRFRQDQAEATS